MTRHLTVVILLLIALYGLAEGWPLLAGPSLTIDAPAHNALVPDGILTVTGMVTRAAIFTLNGAPLLYDQNGHFSSTLTFPEGSSILTFVAADRFGKTIKKTRNIFVPTLNQ